MSFTTLTSRQLDTLQELANIGMGHAATALSQLLGRSIGLRVPRVSLTDLDRVPQLLGGAENLVTGVSLQVFGAARGHILLIFPHTDAERLLRELIAPGAGPPLDSEIGQSTICEVGNILASAYLGALGTLLQQTLIPSVPLLAVDMAGAVVDTVLIELGQHGDRALMLETEFFTRRESRERIRGHVFLLPDPETLHVILELAGADA